MIFLFRVIDIVGIKNRFVRILFFKLQVKLLLRMFAFTTGILVRKYLNMGMNKSIIGISQNEVLASKALAYQEVFPALGWGSKSIWLPWL